MSRFRRRAWMRWFVPIDRLSPSPVATQTDRSGRAHFTPMAIGSARPWMLWKP